MESQSLLLSPGLYEAEPDGDAAALSREDLLALLRDDPDLIITQDPGIMLILWTPRALTAAVRIFQLWLQRDRDRYIRVSRRAIDQTREVVIDANDVSGRAIESALRNITDHD